MKIHPTAIIDSSAEIHESVEIGPYSVIGKNVVIGEGSKIETCVRVFDGAKIGKNNRIKHSAALGGDPQDISFDPRVPSFVEIGDDNFLGEFFTLHRSTKEGMSTKIGNKCFLMENVHVAHDCTLEDGIIMVHCAAFSGHVYAEKNAFISGLTAIHQFCRIGTHAMVAGCSKIVKDIPPYSTVDGNPASVIGLNSVGLKRAGFSPEKRNQIKHAYTLLFHSNINTTKAIEEIKKEGNLSAEVRHIISFFENSERGVTDHRK
jgi:UDP-N-acetylglucosamine acyltransferase